MKSHNALDSAALDELNNPEAKELLDTIDNLRALHVGEIVNLPQIIVVGDQSSGKSSVLEAISHVRFPVKGGVCTRFATELVLRKARNSSVDVRISYADRVSESDPARKGFHETAFDKEALPGLIEAAKEAMGIKVGSTKGFSKDVLRVRITGPDVPSLTLVDLPGFFHSETADQSPEDKRIVDQLTTSYMRQANSIILAVVSANTQHANQIVLGMSKTLDPERSRTLGVITKPDLADEGSDNERTYLQLAKNKELAHQLKLGWHILRNKKENEASNTYDDRDANEAEFLSKGVWSDIPERDKGITSLRKKLSKVLLDHIRETLPGLIKDLQVNLEEREAQLRLLGTARSTPGEMRSYLIDIATKFQRIASDAVNGTYNDKFFGGLDTPDNKLRAKIQNFHCAFALTLSTKGAMQKIVDDDASSGLFPALDEEPVPDHLQSFVGRYKFPKPQKVTYSELTKSLEKSAAMNRGKEFPGIPNRDLVVQLFRKQATPWQGIADFHLDLVTDLVHDFVYTLLEHVIGGDESTLAAVLRSLVAPFFELKRDLLKQKLEEMLTPYTEGYGLPLAGEYHTKMTSRLEERLKQQVTSAVGDEDSKGSEEAQSKKTKRNAGTVLKIVQAISDELLASEFGTEKIVDMMEIYYEMSLRTFTENIINLVVERCLITQVSKILTPALVGEMDDDKLRSLAAESEDIRWERKRLETQTTMLRDGLKLCRQYKPFARSTPIPSVSVAQQQSAKPANGGTSATLTSRAATPARDDTPVRKAPAAAPAAATPANPLLSAIASSPGLFPKPAPSPAASTPANPPSVANDSSSSLFSKPAPSAAKGSTSDLYSKPLFGGKVGTTVPPGGFTFGSTPSPRPSTTPSKPSLFGQGSSSLFQRPT